MMPHTVNAAISHLIVARRQPVDGPRHSLFIRDLVHLCCIDLGRIRLQVLKAGLERLEEFDFVPPLG